MGKMNIKKTEANRIKNRSWDDILYTWITRIFLVIMVGLMLYPVYFVVVASFSSPVYVNNGTFLIFPKGFTLRGYKEVFRDERIWIGYANTIFYTVCGTILGTSVTLLAGYALSRKDFVGRGFVTMIIMITMFISGGLVPSFLNVSNMGLINTRTIIILLGLTTAYNIIVSRTFFATSIPNELLDASQIDGCGNFGFFTRIVLPLSKPIMAVMALYFGVGRWNSYFNEMIYLKDTDKYPLTLFLRRLLSNIKEMEKMINEGLIDDVSGAVANMQMATVMQYCLIVVSTVPMMIIYPSMQKYFAKGVMIGSVKG